MTGKVIAKFEGHTEEILCLKMVTFKYECHVAGYKFIFLLTSSTKKEVRITCYQQARTVISLNGTLTRPGRTFNGHPKSNTEYICLILCTLFSENC